MSLAELRAANFRLLRDPALTLHPRFNLIIGANAAGKTSLLEAVYCLVRGRSFRGQSAAELAGPAGRHWTVTGTLSRPQAPAQRLAVRWRAGTTEIQCDGATATAAELVRHMPAQVLEPGMHRLLQEGPAYRRSFLDWGVFHVEHRFHEVWRRYRRALRQRNQALRGDSDAAVRAWDPELAAAAQALDGLRRRHIADVAPLARQLAARLLGAEGLDLELRSGWPAEVSLEQRLRSQLPRDRRAGLTSEGPHRAELLIRVGEHAARSRASRGQQKLLIGALLLAQCELIRQHTGRAPVLLVDDFVAELAAPAQAALLSVLRAYPGQVLVSAFERAGVLAAPVDGAMFHVEQGRVTPVQC
jgi:DNA replication and repair protein RecF